MPTRPGPRVGGGSSRNMIISWRGAAVEFVNRILKSLRWCNFGHESALIEKGKG